MTSQVDHLATIVSRDKLNTNSSVGTTAVDDARVNSKVVVLSIMRISSRPSKAVWRVWLQDPGVVAVLAGEVDQRGGGGSNVLADLVAIVVEEDNKLIVHGVVSSGKGQAGLDGGGKAKEGECDLHLEGWMRLWLR